MKANKDFISKDKLAAFVHILNKRRNETQKRRFSGNFL